MKVVKITVMWPDGREGESKLYAADTIGKGLDLCASDPADGAIFQVHVLGDAEVEREYRGPG